jgi:hypothetical protein
MRVARHARSRVRRGYLRQYLTIIVSAVTAAGRRGRLENDLISSADRHSRSRSGKLNVENARSDGSRYCVNKFSASLAETQPRPASCYCYSAGGVFLRYVPARSCRSFVSCCTVRRSRRYLLFLCERQDVKLKIRMSIKVPRTCRPRYRQRESPVRSPVPLRCSSTFRPVLHAVMTCNSSVQKISTVFSEYQ